MNDHPPDLKSANVRTLENQYSHLKTKRSSAAIRGAIWSFVNSIVPTLLNSLVFIISSRYLMPHDFGIIALVLSIVSFASAIAPGALGEALIQKIDIHKKHLSTVFWLCLSTALLIYCALVLFAPSLATRFGHSDIAVFLPLLGLKLVFDLSAVVPNALIARSMSFNLIALRTISATIISSAICISLLINGYGIWALAISQLAISITSCIATFISAKWIPTMEFSINELKDLYKYGLFASGNRVLQLMSLDQIIIGSLLGTAPLGIYNFARRLFQMINDVIAGALTSVSHTLLSSLQNEKEKVREAFLLATFASSVVSFPAFIGLAAISESFIPLIFGSQWSGAIEPTQWFCLIGLMSCIGIIQAALITSQGKNNWWFYYQLIRQILTLTTILALRDKDISTIVMAIAIQTVLLWPITLLMVAKIINISVTNYFKQFLPTIIASVGMYLVLLILDYYLKNASMLIRLSIEISASAISYAAIIMFVSKPKIMVIARNFSSRTK